MALSDEMILAEAIRLVDSGVSVTFPVNGRSMLPFIVGGRDSLVLQKTGSVKVGQIVLAYVDGNRHVIHRVDRIVGDDVFLLGDGNLSLREHCKLQDVKALATHVVRETGCRIDLYRFRSKLAAKLWRWCLPFRKYLLKIYLITHKI